MAEMNCGASGKDPGVTGQCCKKSCQVQTCCRPVCPPPAPGGGGCGFPGMYPPAGTACGIRPGAGQGCGMCPGMDPSRQALMKQINEAYDAITKERAGGGAQYKTYTQPGSTSSGSASGPYRDVRSAIMAGDLARAEMILGSIVDRNAEWHFLMGAVAYHRGWMDEASKYFRQAASMDPGNAEYRQAVAQMESQANGPFAGGRAVGMNTLDCGAFCPCMALMATSGGCAPFICCC